MKKTGMIFVFAFLSILFLNLVSAYSPYGGGFYYLGRGGDVISNIVTAGAPILEVLFGNYTESIGDFSSGEILFMKLLIFLILFVILQTVLKKVDLFKDNLAVVGILAVSISLISIRFMSANNLFYGVLLPYGTLGIALTTILPFFIFFLFIHNTGMKGTGRRISWIFFVIIFLVLWANRTTEIGDIGNQIYLWTTISMIGVLIFDKQLHAYLELEKLKKMFSGTKDSQINGLKLKLHNLELLPLEKRDKRYNKEIDTVKKTLKKLTKEHID